MSRYRVYLKPYIGENVYADEFIDISDDVLSINEISQELDNTTYDIGIFKNSGFTLTLRNDHARFSDSSTSKSMFKYKRQDTIVKVTWDYNNSPLKCGFFSCGNAVLGEEVTIFEGLLYETSGVSSIEDQKIQFRFSGYESLFDRISVPYSSITNGDFISDVFYTLLNQSGITSYLTVDAGNINPGLDFTIDDKTALENQTVKEALDSKSLLLTSNSVLYIQNNTIYISNRDANATLDYTFYGQASVVGIENIIGIKDYRDGLNKVFNYVKWPDTSQLASDADSIATYGVQSIEISTDVVSDSSTSKIDSILEEIKDEFFFPKRELQLETPLDYGTIDLFLKDKVNIDYPTIYQSADDNPLPRWGLVTWGNFRWPIGQYSLTIDSADRFKIMGRKINTKDDTITFYLREV